MLDFKRALQIACITASSVALLQPAIASTNLDTAISKGEQRANKAKASQVKIDKIDGQTKSIERDYRAVVKEVEGLEVYVKQLNKQLSAQEAELAQIEQSIKQVTLIERQITPLMLRMIEAIDLFVQADVPFQKEERIKRVQQLQEMMGRSDVTVAEKYRKVMDAYQKEMDYGRTIKTYRASLKLDGSMREVDFLRVGRIALMYQSLDGEKIGIWNQDSGLFEPLASEYKSKLNMALRIAREQAAPDLIKVPLSAPTAGKPSVDSQSNKVAAK